MTKKAIVITGVTHGLGRAMTETFNDQGHTVIGCGRSSDAINDLKTRYPNSDFQVVDLSDEQQVQKWSKRVIQHWGSPDFLINNAGILNFPNSLWKISDAEFCQLIDINLNGVVRTIRGFLPSMVAKRHGMIINFSSGWGRSSAPEFVPYCASKWAIEGLSQGLAQEVPQGMGVVALSPGMINTRMLQACLGEQASHYLSTQEWSQKAVPFILSLTPDNNGQSLTVS